MTRQLLLWHNVLHGRTALAERDRTTGVARLADHVHPADHLPGPGDGRRIRPFDGRLRGARGTHRRSRGPGARLRLGGIAGLGEEPTLAPAGADGHAWTDRARRLLGGR